MNSVLNNAILVFLESERGGTIFDLRRFLIEPAFHAEFLKTVHDSELNYYWKKSFPHLTGDKSKGPILTRLEAFLAPKPIRYMVSQPKNLLDFGHIMDTGKIFLAKLPEGIIGRENSFLLGSLLVAKFQQLAMARQEQDEAARRDFWLYIDEFPNFITPSMAQILRGTRKYRLGLTLAHQEMRQLERDADVASAIMANPETRIYFGVGDDDARKLAQGLSFFEAKDLQNLEPGQAICRIEKANQDFNLTIPNSDPIPADQARATREAVIAESRRKYSRSRSEIEAMLQANLGIVNPQVETKPSPVPTRAEPPKISEVPNRPAGISPESAPASSDTDTTESLHTAIKDKIGAEAETLDYSVTFEEIFPAIQARSDIVLRRGNKTIAAQVTVTTPVKYEVESVRKLLKASFAHIAVISSNRKKMNLIQQTLAGSGDLTERIGFYSPEQFMSQLSDWALNDPEGGKAEKNNPHRNLSLNLLSGALTEAERKQNEKMMLDALKQKLKR